MNVCLSSPCLQNLAYAFETASTGEGSVEVRYSGIAEIDAGPLGKDTSMFNGFTEFYAFSMRPVAHPPSLSPPLQISPSPSRAEQLAMCLSVLSSSLPSSPTVFSKKKYLSSVERGPVTVPRTAAMRTRPLPPTVGQATPITLSFTRSLVAWAVSSCWWSS